MIVRQQAELALQKAEAALRLAEDERDRAKAAQRAAEVERDQAKTAQEAAEVAQQAESDKNLSEKFAIEQRDQEIVRLLATAQVSLFW